MIVLWNFTAATMAENQAAYGLIKDAAVVVQNDRIEWVGHFENLPQSYQNAQRIDGRGKLLTPGLVDCHTHLVWGGCRANEFEMRLQGKSYEEIARAGGGIVSTVSATREASEEVLFESALERARFLICQGVTTLEIKSGYGLNTETEAKQLNVIDRLKKTLPIEIASTFLGAHTIPPEFKEKPNQYVDLVCDEMIPQFANQAEACDVFCESIAFDRKQSERVLKTALDQGMGIKIHAEQLTNTGSARMAAAMGAWSADHLEYIDEAGAIALAANGTTAVLLPGAFYFIRESQIPPINLLRKHGVPIALATDANPGSSPVASITLMMNMACTFWNMTPEEALTGVTLNGARALHREDRLGTIEVGKQADLVIWNVDHPAELAYGIGHNPCRTVFHRGQIVSENGLLTY